MNRLYGSGACAALVLGLAFAFSSAAEEKDKGKEKAKVPSISEIMTKAHKGGDSLLAKARGQIKDKEFDDLATTAKELVQVGIDLGKNTPPAGDKGSWKKLTTLYTKSAVALLGAAKKKNATAANRAFGSLSTSCKACHAVHKE